MNSSDLTNLKTGQTLPEIQNRVSVGPQKTDALQKIPPQNEKPQTLTILATLKTKAHY